ncbi:MAG: MFS transporter [Nisaea sp.]|uniref:MFS transporter n=1 Tax=Nisaea sp. TaxID=2024842 RepID=UPI001B062990|nr:MFS transporter [Nisaea sp.]MBO6559180.1 MFS transporter [Nisaea sp.]
MSVAAVRDQLFGYLNGRFYYGWVILSIAGLGLFTSGPGQSHTFSVFVDPISADLGISSTEIASAYGTATLFAALCLPFAGRLVDRFGPRRMASAIVLCLGLACLFFGAAANVIWLAFGYGFLRFFGQGALMLTSANLTSRWFAKKRGTAMGLMALGFGASIAVHPPLAQFLIETVGWRTAWTYLGLLTWVQMLPAIWLLVIDSPEEKGLSPDGAIRSRPTEGVGETKNDDIPGLTLPEALRTPTFHLIWFSMASIAMLVTSLHFYQVKIFTAQGLDPTVAAWVFPITAGTMVAMMPVVGRVLDRLKTRYALSLALLVQASALLMVTQVSNVPTAVFYAALFGLNNACSMTLFGYIWPRFFGRRHLGSIQGTGQMIMVVGASIGPLPIGYAFDTFGSPTLMIQGLALYPAACAVLALFIRTPAGVPVEEHLE